MAEYFTEEELTHSWVFAFLYYLNVPLALFFNVIDYVGLEKLPPRGEGALCVGYHTTHNQDIISSSLLLFNRSGRLIRGLYHRKLFAMTPLIKYLGGVAGERDTAEKLIRSGELVAVLPGGAEEAIRGHENSYTIKWHSTSGRKRVGFAKVALSCGKPVKIFPIFGKNCEEMRWNPIHWFFNLIGFTYLWGMFLNFSQACLPNIISRVLFFIGAMFWYNTSFFCVPVPVRVTVFVGDPIIADPERDTPDVVADKVRESMCDMIKKHQPYAPSKCYMHALRERFGLNYSVSPAVDPHTMEVDRFLGKLKHSQKE